MACRWTDAWTRNITGFCCILNQQVLGPDDAYMVSTLGQHCFRQWLVACSAPDHWLNQCWLDINSTLRNKFQWNLNQNTEFFFHNHAFEVVVCQLSAILFRLQCFYKTSRALLIQYALHHPIGGPEARITNNLWEVIIQIIFKNSLCSNLDSNDSIKPPICTCHDSRAVMTCANLWLDWIIISHLRAITIFTRFGLWAQKMLVKSVTGVGFTQVFVSTNSIFMKTYRCHNWYIMMPNDRRMLRVNWWKILW